jgi:Phage integrase family.
MQELLQERNAARDAPTEREFQLLYNAAFGSDSYIRQTEDRFLVYGTGRYGLRSGEELHFLHGFEEEWLDRDRKVIKVPAHVDCDCRYCHERAEDIASRREETPEEIRELYWQPKYEASVRVIPYGWSAESIDVVERFADDVGGFSFSQSTLNRRLSELQERAGLEGKLYPHALRAAAGFFWARQGLEAVYLQALMGWQDMRIANRYIRATGQQLNDRVNDLMNVDSSIDKEQPQVEQQDLPDPTEEVYNRTGRADKASDQNTTLSHWLES